MHWKERKTKIENKNSTNECIYFFESNFVGVNRFNLVYSNADDNAKRYKAQRCYLAESIIKNYDIVTNEKNFYDKSIDSDLKRCKEIRKLTTGQGEDYNTDVIDL